MKKKVVCSILLFLFLFSVSVNSSNSSTMNSKNTTITLPGIKTSLNITDKVPLYDIEGTLVAMSLSLNQGYAIIDINSNEILEYSLATNNPFSNNNYKNYYNGPIKYYIEDSNGTIKDVKNNKIIDFNHVKKVDFNNVTINRSAKSLSPSDYFEHRTLSGTLRTWSTPHYCGVDGAAILLMYFDDYINDSFVPSYLEYENPLTDHLINTLYIPDTGTSANDLCNGATGYYGINGYLSNRGLSNYSANYKTYAFGGVVQEIQSGRPAIVGTDPPHPNFDDHWVIAHGYAITEYNELFLIINDGFGTNDIYVKGQENLYYDYIVYIH